MKKFKKILAMVLSLSIMLNNAPISVFAEEAATEEPVVEETQGEEQVIEEEEATSETDFIIEEESVEDAIVEDTIVEDENEEVVESEETPVEEQEFSDVQEEETDSVAQDTTEIVDTEVTADTPADTTTESNDVDTPQNTPVATDVQASYAINLLNEKIESYSLTYADEYRILHLDCGRKFFTKDWIIALINEMDAAGFTHLELAFGNDGLRFLLDDMSVTANGTTYSDDQVTSAIQAGNKAYYDAGSQNELTQTEMDAIIAHANSVGIEVIPLFNNPGHMDTVVYTINSLMGTSVGYDGSASTIDLENTIAVEFTKMLLEKYIDYFASKGCNEFNMGADEYANDIYSTGSMGFGALVRAKKYQLFVDYVNSVANMIKESNMIPMAFNDGIYFNMDTSYSFDTDIMVTFWTSGWTGYQSASASTMANMGHKMINTHGDYYYVLGKTDKFDSDYSYASNWDNDTYMGSTVSTNNQGSMFCIWCDYPDAETETVIAQKVRLVIRAMGAEMNGESASSIDTETVVTGGFNADGTIAETFNNVTLTTENVSVTACDLTSLEVVPVTENVPTVEGATNVVAWDMIPATEKGNYTGSATVKVPVPSNFNTLNMGAFVVNEDGSITKISGEYENGYYTFKMPHFSVGGIYDVVISSESTTTQEITLNVGDTVTVLDETGAYKNAESNKYPDSNIATMKVEDIAGNSNLELDEVTEIISGKSYLIVNVRANKVLAGENYQYSTATNVTGSAVAFGTTASTTNTDLWTISGANGVYTINHNENDVYLNIGSGSATVSSTPKNITLNYANGGYWTLSSDGSYLNDWAQEGKYAAGWNGTGASTDSGSQWKIYEITGGTPDSTEITFTGVGLGSTTAIVGNVTYNINVDYREETINIVKNGTVEKTQNIEITGEPIYSVDGIVTAVVNGSTVTFTAGETIGTTVVTVGNTKYTVNVIEEDLSTVAPLKLEYWITNATVTDSDTNLTYLSISATQSGIYSTEGVAVSELVPDKLQREGRTVEYWQTKLLNVTVTNDSTSGTQEQTMYKGDDETLNDTNFTRVRYWNGSWQALVGTTWTDINRTEVTVKTYDNEAETGTSIRETNQLVAYYMEIVSIENTNGTTELTVNSADWGFKSGDDWGYGTSEFGAYTISFQIVYEDNSTNPEDDSVTALLSKTLVYGEWDERGIGTIIFNGEGDFQIYRVTAETGNVGYVNNYNGFTLNNFTWDDNEATVWSGAPTDSVSIGNNARNPRYDGVYSNLVWHNSNNGDNLANDAILIRIYVRTAAAEDALHVHYLDKTANNLEFYNYDIAVGEGTIFDSGFAKSDGNNLINNSVTNYYGQTQAVSADLASMPQIAAYYRYCNYTLAEVVRSADGKDVYLYYTFTPVVSFVADFGLPIEITPDQLIKNSDGEYNDDAAFADGEIKGVKVIGTYDTDAGSTASSVYGTLNVTGTTVTYTPTTVLKGVDFFTIFVQTSLDNATTTENEESGIAYRVYIYPATTVYYEEGFVETWKGSWESTGSKGSGTQTTSALGDGNRLGADYRYGYDSTYSDDLTVSNNTEAVSKVMGNEASLTFTGTGIEIYAKGTTTSGSVLVQVKNSSGASVKMYMINTVANAGTSDATNGQNTTLYQIPIVSVQDLEHGTYTVVIRHIMNNSTVYIDGFRVFNTHQSNAYANDNEYSDTHYVELRDLVLISLNSSESTAEEIKTQVYDNTGSLNGAVVVSENPSYATDENLSDLLNNGPKNELYLYPQQAVTFTLIDGITAQIGLKSVDGKSLEYTYKLGTNTNDSGDKFIINSSVDMFYHKGANEAVTITNNGAGILSITLIKYTGSASATGILDEVSEEQIGWALMSLRRTVVDEEVETPEVVEPEIGTPEIEKPEVETPDVIDPEVNTPEINNPEVDTNGSEVTNPEAPEGGVANEGNTSSDSDETVEPDNSEVKEELTPDTETTEDEETVTPSETEELPEAEVSTGIIARIIQAILGFFASLAKWFAGLF
ncbi:MAG: family 20 glycosylhydrolase [Erysipelotrichaceae bacterium]|nr:family 20 glycosylhydrolase [Erysipelotrichaceae bacterium]